MMRFPLRSLEAFWRGKQPVSAIFTSRRLRRNHDYLSCEVVDRTKVRKTLCRGGSCILAESPLGIAVSGAPAAYEQITNGRLVAVERLTRAERGRTRYVTNLDVTGRGQPKELGVATPESASLKRKVDGILLERPQMPMSIFPSPIPPTSVRSHLRLPGDVAVGLSATNPHRSDLTGQDVFVVMPDTGWFRHPYFTANHYQVDKPNHRGSGDQRERRSDRTRHGRIRELVRRRSRSRTATHPGLR